ncbi:MAG TPA: polysaccharide pyruvyl transferase family protein [Kiritimatiellia bacterium]|nr:polysaccharide pyruvyl transferase family protein [Kiritimatiellia bacterium]
MKIGIVTLCEANNYGGVLQAYALQTYLRRMGHESAVLPVDYAKRRNSPLKVLERPVKTVMEAVKAKKFASFRAKHFRSPGVTACRVDAFLRQPPRFDAYVCGSDQVWSRRACADSELRKYFFLDFGEVTARRISYAASWGAQTLEPAVRDDIRACLQKFTALSVREKSGQGIVADLGFTAQWLPDPTFLLEEGEWRRLAEDEPRTLGDNVLFQCEYRWTPCVRLSEINRVLVRQFGWDTVIPFSDHPFRDAVCTRCLTPSQWVNGIRRASLVLTNSFHGMVFSIIFRRPFIAVPLAGKYAGMNERFLSLAERLGLQDRLLTDPDPSRIIALAQAPIDWESVYRHLNDWRREASTFLASALQ